MLVLPILAGAGMLALLMAGAGKKKGVDSSDPLAHEGETTTNGDIATPPKVVKEKTRSAVDAAKAAKAAKSKAEQDAKWQLAAAEALASGSKKLVASIADQMKKAGYSKEALSLLKAFSDLRAAAEKARIDRVVKPVKKPTAKLPGKKRERPVKVTPPKVEAKPKPKEKPKAKPPKVLPPKSTVSPLAQTAIDMTNMLFSSSRYKEDDGLVTKYQLENGLEPDGQYGPASARSLWNLYRIVPPNPYYFSKSAPTAAANEYRRFLVTIQESGTPEQAAKAAELAKTVGK